MSKRLEQVKAETKKRAALRMGKEFEVEGKVFWEDTVTYDTSKGGKFTVKKAGLHISEKLADKALQILCEDESLKEHEKKIIASFQFDEQTGNYAVFVSTPTQGDKACENLKRAFKGDRVQLKVHCQINNKGYVNYNVSNCVHINADAEAADVSEEEDLTA